MSPQPDFLPQFTPPRVDADSLVPVEPSVEARPLGATALQFMAPAVVESAPSDGEPASSKPNRRARARLLRELQNTGQVEVVAPPAPRIARLG